VDTFKRLTTLLFVLLLLVVGNVPSVGAIPPDNGGWPIVVIPEATVITDNQDTAVVVYMNKVVTSDTTVTVTSSHPSLISVPASVVVPTGYSSVEIPLTVSPSSQRFTKPQASTAVTITATANGHSAATVIEVE
jgi:hypothetical protein